MSKISVIIPIYNVEKYLKKCLDSVVNQTFKDIEIICVNDGSTDNSKNILEEYAKTDSRIKIINQENAGLGSARNAGIKQASADYIYFLDSDDYIELETVEKMYNKAAVLDWDICVHKVREVDVQIKFNKKYKIFTVLGLKFKAKRKVHNDNT